MEKFGFTAENVAACAKAVLGKLFKLGVYMSYNPLSEIANEPLAITTETLRQLGILRASEKFTDLPGTDTILEKERLSLTFNKFLDHLLDGVQSNPNKLWVMGQFQQALEVVQGEDTEGRECFGDYLEQVLDILQIDSSDGLLSFYL